MMLLVLSFFAEENDVSGVIREWETSGKSPEEKEVVSIGGDDVVSVIVVTTAVVSSLSDLDIEDTNEVRLWSSILLLEVTFFLALFRGNPLLLLVFAGVFLLFLLLLFVKSASFASFASPFVFAEHSVIWRTMIPSCAAVRLLFFVTGRWEAPAGDHRPIWGRLIVW